MFIKKQLVFTIATSLMLLGCGGKDSIIEGATEPSTPVSTTETNEIDDEAYQEIYDGYERKSDELIEEFNEEALDPDIFFAEYGITSVYEEKAEQMEVEGLKAQDELEKVLENELGSEEDWRSWTHQLNELYIQKVQELDGAHELMLKH